MFDFYDPCESCSQPLDSPACKECKYYDPCESCPLELDSRECKYCKYNEGTCCEYCCFDKDSAACWGNESCPYEK